MKSIISERKDEEGFSLILCPKEKKEVPIYRCAGSFVKGTDTCEFMRYATMGAGTTETVTCMWPEKRENASLSFRIGPQEEAE